MMEIATLGFIIKDSSNTFHEWPTGINDYSIIFYLRLELDLIHINKSGFIERSIYMHNFKLLPKLIQSQLQKADSQIN